MDTVNAVEPKPGGARPAVKRMLQCVSGSLEFECGGDRFPLQPGEVVHLRAYVPHAVYCPDSAPEEGNVLLLSMLTGERH
ncbi:hypothetical protein CKJ84_00775 [Corynebacterium sp. NML 120412]|nr:hypothetical protein CKJ84_00775 [Corynebacterium sp. NML 120412]